VGLRAKDLKITSTTRQKPEPRITLTFRCKGHTSLRDTLDAETSAVVLDYLHAQYSQHLLTLPPDAPLWVSYCRQNPGQPIGTGTLSQICTRLEDSDLCLGAGIAEVRRPPGRTEQETIQ
jgi:hypothetical protein